MVHAHSLHHSFATHIVLDMDHHVPLARAHISGGDCWPREQMRAYANDLGYDGVLNASAAGVNCGNG